MTTAPIVPFDTQITLTGPWRGPGPDARRSSPTTGTPSVHDGDTAASLGLIGAPDRGADPLQPVRPAGRRAVGRVVVGAGLHQQPLPDDGRRGRAGAGVGDDDQRRRLASIEAHKADGTPVLGGTISLGPDHPRDRARGPAGGAGRPGRAVHHRPARGRHGALRRRSSRRSRSTRATDRRTRSRSPRRRPRSPSRARGTRPTARPSNPWGQVDRAVRDAQRADQQVGSRLPGAGPGRSGCSSTSRCGWSTARCSSTSDYELHREVVGLSQSQRTESYWTETTVTEPRLRQPRRHRAAAPGRLQGVLRRLPARPPGGLRFSGALGLEIETERAQTVV